MSMVRTRASKKIAALIMACLLYSCREPQDSAVGFDGLSKEFCLVTQHSGKHYDYISLAVDSQQRYALAHGYTHQAYWGRISGDDFVDPSQGDLDTLFGGGFYWQKITAVEQMLAATATDSSQGEPLCQWVMWLDSDVVITNETLSLEDIVARYAPPVRARDPNQAQVDIILSTEQFQPVNAGVFLIRNTAVGRAYIKAVAALYPRYKSHLLPEQDAMTDLALSVEPWQGHEDLASPSAQLHAGVTIVAQRTFNSFPDMGRNLSEEARWQPGDFVAHFAGVKRSRRAQGMVELLAMAQRYQAE